MIRVAALYRFARFPDPVALRQPLLDLCADNSVKGTLLLAIEGINGTIAGPPDGIGRVLEHIRTLPDCAELEVKFSTAETMPFHRLKVRLKREIGNRREDALVTADAQVQRLHRVVVRVERRFAHPLLQKTVRRSKKYKAHDEQNTVKTGDIVSIEECAPISKDKRWRVVQVHQ